MSLSAHCEALNAMMEEVSSFAHESFEIYYYNQACPTRSEENHDSLMIAGFDPNALLLCVADGAGGHRQAAEASSGVLSQLKEALGEKEPSLDNIIAAIETSNQYIRTNFSASRTTLILALIQDDHLRVLHVGDSKLVLVGGRGRLKYETVGHNLYEISVSSGLIEYLSDDEEVPSNVVTNMIGDPEYRLELSTNLEIAPQDTVVMGSDGLFDNISIDEISEICSKGSLEDCAKQIMELTRKRMADEDPQELYKPDDCAFILCKRKDLNPPT